MSEQKNRSDWRAVGERIRSRRILFQLSLEQLAERAGCSVRYLQELEAGRKQPGRDLAVRLTKELHMSLDFLLSGAPAGTNEKEAALIDMIHTCPPAQFENLESIIAIFLRSVSGSSDNARPVRFLGHEMLDQADASVADKKKTE